MPDRKEVLPRFLKDVAEHVVTVKLDVPGYRHLRCQKPGTWCMGFDIVTYPGMLVYSGDMGCFAFSRLPDMFELFRDAKPRGADLEINPRYWSEKLQGEGGRGHDEFSEALFRSEVTRWVDEAELDAAARAEVMERLEEDVFACIYDGEYPARAALRDFDDKRVDFTDFFEVRCREYTFHFLWCCYALVWAIREFDAIKAPATADATTEEHF